MPGVRNFGAHIGRAEVADEVVGPELHRAVDQPRPVGGLRGHRREDPAIVDGYPGLYRDLLTYLRERIKEVLTGASATIVVRIYGPTWTQLRAQAQSGESRDRRRRRRRRPEGAGAGARAADRGPVRPGRAAAFGLTPGEVRRAAATLVQGTKVGEFYEEQQLFDVVVWGTPDVRRNLDAIRALQVPLANGGMVPLGSVADVSK